MQPTANGEPVQRARALRDALPPGALFAERDWRVAPAPFPLPSRIAAELDALGRVLLKFLRAVNQLHRQSREGRQPAWVHQLLDQGKPSRLLDWQQDRTFAGQLPRVIRPDILLTDDGMAITELDSVPGGIGATAFLNQAYARFGDDVIGGPSGMLDGFAGIFGDAPKVWLMVSEESATYRPEMEWLARELTPGRFEVCHQAFTGFATGDAIYRFFELFDLGNVPAAATVFDRAAAGELLVTPPPRPMFEEKLLFALLWNRNLHEFWRQQLGEGFFRRLLELVPYTWVVDPAPLPPHAALPEMNLTDWQQLKSLSQRERNLILKVSGYSERAWGARGVHLGGDLSQADWAQAVDEAIRSFSRSPYVLQRFHKPRIVEAAWVDFATDTVVAMPGRLRLCPYYFVRGEGDAARAHLGGVLATICPADKKIIHGMKDAIMAPCTTAP